MSTESWQLETRAAQRYEAIVVPALMAVWASHLVAAVGVQSGDRVLDVACGTGVVTAAAAERAGVRGSVVGLDLNPAMLAVAQELHSGIEWRQGDATALPFPDASFDRVTCQFSLMYFPDRQAALSEMHRVLRGGGSIALTTWAAIERCEAYRRLAEIEERLGGAEAGQIARAPFVLADPAELERMLALAGFATIETQQITEPATFSSIDVFLEAEIDATPLGEALREIGDGCYDQVLTAVREEMEKYATSDGVAFPIVANLASASVPGVFLEE